MDGVAYKLQVERKCEIWYTLMYLTTGMTGYTNTYTVTML